MHYSEYHLTNWRNTHTHTHAPTHTVLDQRCSKTHVCHVSRRKCGFYLDGILVLCEQQRHQSHMPNSTHHSVLPGVPLGLCCCQCHRDCHHQNGFLMHMIPKHEATQRRIYCCWQEGFCLGVVPQAEEAREQCQKH